MAICNIAVEDSLAETSYRVTFRDNIVIIVSVKVINYFLEYSYKILVSQNLRWNTTLGDKNQLNSFN